MDYTMMGLVGALLTVAFLFGIKAKKETLEKEEVRNRIGSLYIDVDTNRKAALLVTFVFAARRVLFVILVVQPFIFI
jgi:hypothetical protein